MPRRAAGQSQAQKESLRGLSRPLAPPADDDDACLDDFKHDSPRPISILGRGTPTAFRVSASAAAARAADVSEAIQRRDGALFGFSAPARQTIDAFNKEPVPSTPAPTALPHSLESADVLLDYAIGDPGYLATGQDDTLSELEARLLPQSNNKLASDALLRRAFASSVKAESKTKKFPDYDAFREDWAPYMTKMLAANPRKFALLYRYEHFLMSIAFAQGWPAANAYHWAFFAAIHRGEHSLDHGPDHALSLRLIDRKFPLLKKATNQRPGNTTKQVFCPHHQRMGNHKPEDCFLAKRKTAASS